MITLVFDTEATGLLDTNPSLHCVQIGDADGEDSVLYGDKEFCDFPLADGIARLRGADVLISHNGLAFDVPLLTRFYPNLFDGKELLDTLVMGRLAYPEEKNQSLAGWGNRLNCPKSEFIGDYAIWTEDFAKYARVDIVVGRALYHAVKHVRDWGFACDVEHEVHKLLLSQTANGFPFNLERATILEAELRGQLAEVEAKLGKVFPPKTKERRFTPKVNSPKLGYVKGVEHVKTWEVPFDAGSRQHVAERLQDLGWKPKHFGKDGVATVDEKILATLRYPEAKLIIERFKISKKLGMLSDGANGWLKLAQKDRHGVYRIHGRVNGNGAMTGRMTHSKPNLAQVDKDPEMRGLFTARPGWKLVGCDAEGIEARMLAHYIGRFDGGVLADRLVNGDKSKGTDVHSANLAALRPLGLMTRDGAKTVLYALIYGAGNAKLGAVIKADAREHGGKSPAIPPTELGILARKALDKSMVGIEKLTAEVSSRKSFKGLDGRILTPRGTHSALNTLLQGAAALCMKLALLRFHKKWGESMGKDWALVANVHDELECEAKPEIAEALGQAIADAIRDVGESLKLRCPLAGAYAVGNNWQEVH